MPLVCSYAVSSSGGSHRVGKNTWATCRWVLYGEARSRRDVWNRKIRVDKERSLLSEACFDDAVAVLLAVA
eukprot:3696962-Amphidinium_carterae.2